MKPIARRGIETLLILAVAIGLGLTFNATRPHPLPLIPTEKAQEQAADRYEISLQEAAALFTDEAAFFVDARDAESYAEGHIQGALHVTLDNLELVLAEHGQSMAGKTVISYCDGEACPLSHDLAAQLKARGIPDVVVLKNGWTLWQNANLPTTTGYNP